MGDRRPDGPRRPPRLCFSADEPEVVATDGERRSAGLHHWVDGTMGILRHDSQTTVFAPDGARTARHDVGAETFLGSTPPRHLRIEQPVEVMDHASGGPVIRDDDTGALLMLYHGERFVNGDPADYWAFLGLASSDDGGASFHDLGPVVTSQVAEHDPTRARPIDVGAGGLVAWHGWLYCYFVDRSIRSRQLHLGVARARVHEVFAAARAGRVPALRKYHRGWFSQPAIGGRATDLLPDAVHPVIWLDAAVIRDLDLVLVVHSTVTEVRDGVPRWTHVGRTSADGIRWSEPVPLYEETTDAEIIYLTIDSTGPVQRRIDTDHFDLYRTSSRSSFRWDDACLERVRVRWQPAAGLGR